MASQWNTLTIEHHHPLRSFAFLGFPDNSAPFFAGAKLPSINTSLQSKTPSVSNWDRKVRHIFNQTPPSSHRLSLLQQVAGLGYISGRCFQRARAFSNQKIPSTTLRSSARGQPVEAREVFFPVVHRITSEEPRTRKQLKLPVLI
jgi:hypothetical protein